MQDTIDRDQACVRAVGLKLHKGPLLLSAVFCLSFIVVAQNLPNGAAIDAEVSKIMTRTHAKGMAVAVIDHGKVGYVHAYGIRNAKGDPLDAQTPSCTARRSPRQCSHTR